MISGRQGSISVAQPARACHDLRVDDSLARARADLAAGRAWKARDRLVGTLTHRQDNEVLDLLATVHHTMHDLPAAGGLWFAAGRSDEFTAPALAAWRERHGNDQDRWRSLPAPVRRHVDSPALRTLEASAKREESAAVRARRKKQIVAQAGSPAWETATGLMTGAFLFWLLAMMGLGIWTFFAWFFG